MIEAFTTLRSHSSNTLRAVFLRNREISAFNAPLPKLLCVTPYDAFGQLIAENRFADLHPRGYRYLQSHRKRLVVHPGSDVPWYSFRSAAALKLPPGPKVMLKRISVRPDYTVDPAGTLLCNGTVILLAPTSKLIDPLVLLAIVNSSRFWNFVRTTMPTMGDGFALRVSRLREFCFPVGHDTDWESRIQDLVEKRLKLSPKSAKSATVTNLINQAVARLYESAKRT